MDDYTARSIGPREIGGRYWNGYWRTEYEVIGITVGVGMSQALPWAEWSITVRDAEGTRTHCTAWDAKHDRTI